MCSWHHSLTASTLLFCLSCSRCRRAAAWGSYDWLKCLSVCITGCKTWLFRSCFSPIQWRFCRSCSLQEKGRAAAGSAHDISHPRCASTVELTPSPMTNTHPCLSGASENKQLHLLDVNIITCNLLLNGTGLLFNYLINVFVQLYIWCKNYVTEYTWKCISRIQYSLTLALAFNIS